MKSTSHFAMGHLIYAALNEHNISLNRTAFVYGNIAPDYNPAMVVTPHFGKVCTRYVEEFSRRLAASPLDNSGRVGAEYSKKLGMICHFICDYFCFAHNKDFVGGVKPHFEFENSLDLFLRDNWKDLLELEGFDGLSRCRRCNSLMEQLEEEKRSYTAGGYCFENDLSYAFRACLGLIQSIVAMSQVNFALSGARLEGSPLSLKGYATGNCYVFRMFYYKNRNNNVFFLPELMSTILT